MLGEYDPAMEKYIEALQLYDKLHGKQTISYASTLHNLAAVYRMKAMESRGMDKLELLERAQEAIQDVITIREQLLGSKHKETLQSKILQASIFKTNKQIDKAENLLLTILKIAIKEYDASIDLLIATIQNNLGLLYKEKQQWYLAKDFYQKAFNIRSSVLGDEHPETIIVMHNLAECLLAMGEEQQAKVIQEKILANVKEEIVQQNTPSTVTSSTPVTPSTAEQPINNNNNNNNNNNAESIPQRKPPIVLHKPVSRRKR
jgi:tetratricopeptide (TPR) repeat protein